MTEQEYRQHPAVSRSELWKLRDSPQKFRYAKDHPEAPTPALLFGQVFHKLALEPDTFLDEYVVAKDIDRRTKAGKAEWAELLALGKTIVPFEMYNQAVEMCEALQTVPLAEKLLNGQREVPFFWSDDLTGEECKCRVDCLNTNLSTPVVVDLKTTGDASMEGFAKSAINYGYDFQAAMYSEGVERNIGQRPLFVFIAVEKDPPHAVNIFQADELLLRRGANLYREFMDTYHDCKLSGNWYGYLGKDSHINNLALPAWLAREIE